MRLTQFSDYALRTLIHVAARGDQLTSISQVAKGYRISYHHLVKVAALLVQLGVIEAVRGRGGGMRLAVPPEQINVGWLVRRTEPDFNLVECFDREHGNCPITRACRLKHILYDAQVSFLQVLDEYTLADILHQRTDRLLKLLRDPRS